MRRIILLFSLAVVAALPVLAEPAAGPHPDAPPETEQFAFLIGDWDCTIRSMRPDGSYSEGKAEA